MNNFYSGNNIEIDKTDEQVGVLAYRVGRRDQPEARRPTLLAEQAEQRRDCPHFLVGVA